MSYTGTMSIADLADAMAKRGQPGLMKAPDLIGRASQGGGGSGGDMAGAAKGIGALAKVGADIYKGDSNPVPMDQQKATNVDELMAALPARPATPAQDFGTRISNGLDNIGTGISNGLSGIGSFLGFAGGGAVNGGLPRPHHVGQNGGLSHFREKHGGLARGLIHSATPGRADHVPARVRRGSYVVPADVVSGLGQSNTMAGANALKQALGSHGPIAYAAGGDTGDDMDVRLSGGEYVLTPEEVTAIGRGDHGAGAEVLDGLVHSVRRSTMQTLGELPPPK